MTSRLSFAIAIRLCLAAIPAAVQGQGYEGNKRNDYLSPGFFYDLMGVDSSYLNRPKPRFRYNSFFIAPNYISNYQFRNSYVKGSYAGLQLRNLFYTNKFQLNAEYIGLLPLQGWGTREGRKQVLQRTRFQIAHYLFADQNYDLKFRKDLPKGYVYAEPNRIMAYFNRETRDTATFNEVGLEYIMGFDLTDAQSQSSRNRLRSFQGGYVFSWRLNTRDFFYALVYNYEIELGSAFLNSANVTLGISRNKIRGNDRWGNLKAGANIQLNIVKAVPLRLFYSWTRELRHQFTNHEFGVAIDLKSFSAFQFLDYPRTGEKFR